MSLLLPRIFRSLDLMLDGYKDGAKSKHWQRFFTDEMIAGLHDPFVLSRFRSNFLSDDIEETTRWFKTIAAYFHLVRLTGPEWIRAYSESKVGHPKAVKIGGTRVTITDLSFLHFLWTISQYFKGGTVCGIGAGYGALPHKIKRRFPLVNYVLLDLPEALTLQAYYLSKLHPDASFYLYDDFMAGIPIQPKNYDFTLLPGWLADRLEPQSVDLFINTRSFMEMNKDVIEEYFRQIARCLKIGGLFFNANRYSKESVGEPIRFRDYPYNGGWDVQVSRPSFLQPHVHEMLTVRTDKPSTRLKEELMALPEKMKVQSFTGQRSIKQILTMLPLVSGSQ